ncbi:MerR family transcriptional regulator [Bradyrhizobium sp. F1.13.3]|uniref:MerR family transcriptional regulator n=1 Tax=Bradyrhizobium sp. F1.13.3 TaxID=3156351 RepID=UPI0033939C1E
MTHKLRFDDVRHALDMTAPALRRWLQFKLIGNTAKSKAREGKQLQFTLDDLAVLALVKVMAEYGVPIAAAYKIAAREVDQAGPWSGDQTAESFWSRWAPDTQIIVSRAEDKNGNTVWKIAKFENAEVAYTLGAHLTLYPRALIRAAIQRGVESVESRDEKRRA